jgi:hypothetical protein
MVFGTLTGLPVRVRGPACRRHSHQALRQARAEENTQVALAHTAPILVLAAALTNPSNDTRVTMMDQQLLYSPSKPTPTPIL